MAGAPLGQNLLFALGLDWSTLVSAVRPVPAASRCRRMASVVHSSPSGIELLVVGGETGASTDLVYDAVARESAGRESMETG